MSNPRYNPNKMIRCVQSSALYEIAHDQYKHDVVCVYYGFDNYSRTVEQIVMLCDLIKNEMPDTNELDMDVCEIRRSQSDRHAGQTMIQLCVKTDEVRKHIANYTAL